MRAKRKYFLGYISAEQRRLQQQAGELADESAWLPRKHFDLATARLVLVNIPEPEKIIAEMAALVKSGGVVATGACFLLQSEWNRSIHWSAQPRMLRNAGLVDVRVNPLIHIYAADHSRRPIFLQFVNNLHERIVADGLISEAEFAECISHLERHLADPDTLVVSHVFIQAWGRKP